MAIDTQIGAFRKTVQEVFAPELSEIKADLLALHREVILRFEVTQKQIDQRLAAEREHTDQRFTAEREHTDQRFDQIDQRLAAERRENDLRFHALLEELRHAREQADAHAQAMKDSFNVLGLQLEVGQLRSFSEISGRLTALENRLQLNS